LNFQWVSTKLNASSWALEPIDLYQKKISNEKLEKAIKPDSIKICFDERGRSFTSEKFADFLSCNLNSGKRNIQFFVGGPYGLSEPILEQAHQVVSLSSLVLCQEVALVTAFEQVYRSLTILKNIPYHNA